MGFEVIQLKMANVWGQGQIFAFSALDGKNMFGDDFIGILCGDRFGIEFQTKVKRTLFFTGFVKGNFDFTYVCGDYINLKSQLGNVRVLYYDTHLVVGDLCEGISPLVFTEGVSEKQVIDGIEIADSQDGEFTAIGIKNNIFAFSFGKSAEEAVTLVKTGLSVNIDKASADKESFYRNNTVDCEFSKLYCKCLSVMKTQLLSPEGRMDKIWSTPDRLPHRGMWLWDSVFHALGHRNYDIEIAKQLILSLIPHQSENGMLPHHMTPMKSSEISQPPVIAWGAWKIYESSGDREFLKQIFNCNSKFLRWCNEARCHTEEPLYVWHVSDDENCRCDESGMDNSPRFDSVVSLQAIDFSCFMANEMRYMKIIADELGESGSFYEKAYEDIKNAINKKLWDNEDGFYYDYDLDKNNIHKVKSVASFLPLFAGVCSETQAKKLVEKLNDKDEFCSEFMIPSVGLQDSTFGSDMWRGPVWINYNYMISEGLKSYGYTELATKIRKNTIEVVNFWYEQTGTVYEFYDCENQKMPSRLRRKGDAIEPYNFKVRFQSIRDYGWTATLTCDMIADLYRK